MPAGAGPEGIVESFESGVALFRQGLETERLQHPADPAALELVAPRLRAHEQQPLFGPGHGDVEQPDIFVALLAALILEYLGGGPPAQVVVLVPLSLRSTQKHPNAAIVADHELFGVAGTHVGTQAGQHHDGELQPLGLMDGHDANDILALSERRRAPLAIAQVVSRLENLDEAGEVR